ncbi:Aromatic peroxygenase [Phytophthora nicotianae]|nr:Aromatic peroxygenase [Phytophthora nicotianae]
MDVFNVDEGLAERLTRPLPPQLTLADLSVHGFIEHDASLVHDDTYVKRDPAQVNTTLADNVFAKSVDGKLNKHTMAKVRKERETQCKKENPEYALPVKAQATAYGESALLLIAMGDYESKTISVNHAKSFMVDEKIPDDFQRSDKPISTAAAFYLAAQIKLLASLGWGC